MNNGTLRSQEYYCVLTDTGLFTIYASDDAAAAIPSTFVKQFRLGGAKVRLLPLLFAAPQCRTQVWSGKTMFSSMDNSFKFVSDKGKEFAASGRNRNEGSLWVKSITAVTDPDSHEGQKLAKAKRKQLRQIERELKKQQEYEIRAKAHRAPPSAATMEKAQPISYLTDPRRTRLDARNFPKYRQNLQDAKLETRLTAPLDEAKPVAKKKKKKKRPEQDEAESPSSFAPPPPPPPPVTASAAPSPMSPINGLSDKFQNLLKLGFSHDEVKHFMKAEGHSTKELEATSRQLQHQPLPQSPLKKPRQQVDETQPPPPPKASFLEKLKNGFRKA